MKLLATSLLAISLFCLPVQAVQPRVIVSLIVASESNGLAVRGAIIQSLLGKGLLPCSSTETHILPRVLPHEDDGTWSVDASLCFNQRLEAENWKADLQQKWTSGPLPIRNMILPGSFVSFHVCANEETGNNRYNCKTHILAEFTLVSK